MTVRILHGDCREILPTLPADSVHCCVTSPPYWGLRDYGVAGQIGLEPSLHEWVAEMVAVFREVRRVLRPDGTLWLNLGDAYHSPRLNGGVGENSTINGKEGLEEFRRDRIGRTAKAGQDRAALGDVAHRASPIPGIKPKDMLMMPARVALALQADGWWLRSQIVWAKPNPMPESVTDRPTKAHEMIYLLSKAERYFYDAEAIKEPASPDTHARYAQNGGAPNETSGWADGPGPHAAVAHNTVGGRARARPRKGAPNGSGVKNNPSFDAAMAVMPLYRNKRDVWTVVTQAFPEAHFATFPPALIEPCILAGCPEGGTVLDPFGGAGTTGLVADRLHRNAVLIELNPEYIAIGERRIRGDSPLFAEVQA